MAVSAVIVSSAANASALRAKVPILYPSKHAFPFIAWNLLACLWSQASEEFPYVRHKRLRFLHRGEMPACGQMSPALQIVVTLGPAPCGLGQLGWKDRDAHRRRDHRHAVVRRLPRIARAFKIEAGRCVIAVGYPIEHDCVDQF